LIHNQADHDYTHEWGRFASHHPAAEVFTIQTQIAGSHNRTYWNRAVEWEPAKLEAIMTEIASQRNRQEKST